MAKNRPSPPASTSPPGRAPLSSLLTRLPHRCVRDLLHLPLLLLDALLSPVYSRGYSQVCARPSPPASTSPPGHAPLSSLLTRLLTGVCATFSTCLYFSSWTRSSLQSTHEATHRCVRDLLHLPLLLLDALLSPVYSRGYSQVCARPSPPASTSPPGRAPLSSLLTRLLTGVCSGLSRNSVFEDSANRCVRDLLHLPLLLLLDALLSPVYSQGYSQVCARPSPPASTSPGRAPLSSLLTRLLTGVCATFSTCLYFSSWTRSSLQSTHEATHRCVRDLLHLPLLLLDALLSPVYSRGYSQVCARPSPPAFTSPPGRAPLSSLLTRLLTGVCATFSTCLYFSSWTRSSLQSTHEATHRCVLWTVWEPPTDAIPVHHGNPELHPKSETGAPNGSLK